MPNHIRAVVAAHNDPYDTVDDWMLPVPLQTRDGRTIGQITRVYRSGSRIYATGTVTDPTDWPHVAGSRPPEINILEDGDVLDPDDEFDVYHGPTAAVLRSR
jgi:hypothetical protein